MDPAAVGAFLSGAAAVVSSIVSLRLVQKRDRQECDQRIREIMDAMREGAELGDRRR